MNKLCTLVMSHKHHSIKKQQGSSIVLAIFVIVIIALLTAALASLQRDSAQSTSYEVYAARAYLSAYSASELALVSLFPLDSREADPENCTQDESLDADDVITVVLGSDVGFHGCTASYTCQILTSETHSAGLATRYKVVSMAICKNAQTVTRRQITLEAVSL